jgi:signal transduction histidine kinase
MALLLTRSAPAMPNADIGLGLWTASRLLARVNGRVEIDTGPGEGTTLTIAIPIAAPEALHAVA